MKMKKTFLVGMASVILATSVSFGASAAKAEIQTIGDIPTRIITDFENLDGATTDNHDAFFGSGSANGVDFGVKGGLGTDASKALVFGNVTADNYYAEASYNPNFDDGAKTEGFEGATDFIMHVDAGGETDGLAFQFVFGEWEYTATGEPRMKKNPETGKNENAITFWKFADDVNTVYYALEDGGTSWTKYTGTSNSYVRLPSGFKGYVRIPLDSFDPSWNSTDANDKVDFKHFTRFSFYYGMYNRHKTTGYAMAIDDIGFCGAELAQNENMNNNNNNGNNAGNNSGNNTGGTVDEDHSTGGNTGDNDDFAETNDVGKNENTPFVTPDTGDATAIYVLISIVLASGILIVLATKNMKDHC
ncbi:MAG: hypothetical protein MJ132_05045 [Clostridia bacterium]|nr:hypothetical protein [Clostridia bacterium]